MNNNDKPKQIEAKKIGSSGCYFLSIIHGVISYADSILHKKISVDIIRLYEIAVNEKWSDEDCFIERPDLLAGYILGVPLEDLRTAFQNESAIKQVKIKKEKIDYVATDNEIEITRYEYKKTGSTYAHFVETRNNQVIYDPYGSSITVTAGTPVSKRILTIGM